MSTTPSGENAIVWEKYWAAHDRRAEFYTQKPIRISCNYARELDEFDHTIFGYLKGCGKVLDIGAGNGVTRGKMRRLGFAGQYDTLDSVGGDHRYTDIDQIEETYDAILLLEVIEHLPIDVRTRYLDKMVNKLLNPGGVILISTPNADHINAFNRECWTHCQSVPLRDLFCFFDAIGLETTMYRVNILPDSGGNPLRAIKDRVRRSVYRIACYFLYSDPEERVLFVARRRL